MLPDRFQRVARRWRNVSRRTNFFELKRVSKNFKETKELLNPRSHSNEMVLLVGNAFKRLQMAPLWNLFLPVDWCLFLALVYTVSAHIWAARALEREAHHL